MKFSRFALLTTSSFIAFSSAAFAADQAAESAVEEVIVTGSRIERAGYEAPTPVTMANRDEIQAAAAPALGEYLSRMPSFGTAPNANNPNHSMSGGQAGISLVSLRQLGVNRTLVLFDGRRVNASTLVGGVDMNLIPDSIVQRIDIVTGGASAAWGSDAVGGVVNIITNKEFTGVEARVESGVNTRGLGFTHKEDITAGAAFHDGRGHVIGSFTYTDTPNYIYPNDMPWYQSTCLFPNAAYTPTNAEPRLVLVGKFNRSGECGFANTTRGGLITSGPLKNTQFIGNGEAVPYVVDQVAGTRAVGRDADPAQLPLRSLQGPIKRYNFYSNVNYALTDDITANLELNYSNAKGSFHTAFYNRVNNITVKADNAYLPQSIRTAMTALGLTSFTMGKDIMDLDDGQPLTLGGSLNGEPTARVQSLTDRKLWRGVASLEGSVFTDWKWDAYYMHGEARTDNKAFGNPYVPNFNSAIDAVLDPATGRIVCRTTLTNATSGCVPANIFGVNTISREAANYINNAYHGRQVIYTTLDVAAGTISGSPLSLWAGPVDIATGFEWRKETARATADAQSDAKLFFSGNYSPLPKRAVNVKEGFAEVNVPLARDMTFARSLDVNAAVRVTDYSSSGTVVTWKAGVTYVPVDEVRLRATRSRDIRAPTISELFTPGLSATTEVADLFKNDKSVSIFSVAGGNAGLTPEIATTWTGGAVYSPMWFEGFQASIDYYSIDVRDAISTPSNITILQQCRAGIQVFCPLIKRAAPLPGETLGDITQIDRLPVNAAVETVRGLDLEASYSTPIGPGEANFRAMGTYYLEMSNVLNGVYSDNVGSISAITPNATAGLPHLKLTTNARYTIDAYSFGLEATLIGKAKLSTYYTAKDLAPSENRVPAVMYFNFNTSYDFEAFGTQSRLYLRIDNVMDKAPPTQGEAGPALYNGGGPMVGIYDLFGRFFRGGVRVKF